MMISELLEQVQPQTNQPQPIQTQRPKTALSLKDKHAISLAINEYYEYIKKYMVNHPQTREIWKNSTKYKDDFKKIFIDIFAAQLHLNSSDPVFDAFKPITYSQASLKKAMNDVILAIYAKGLEPK